MSKNVTSKTSYQSTLTSHKAISEKKEVLNIYKNETQNTKYDNTP